MGEKKILIVDFDHEFLRFLSQFLRNEGFAVVTASDGTAGLEAHKVEAPDLVITEAMLPKLHGFELCSRISHSASRMTPVIIVTGVYRDTVYKTEALHTFGASAYFEKPLDPDDLLASVRKVLGIPQGRPKDKDPIDAAIMEALVAPPPPPAPAKPEAKPDLEDDIDGMLRNTLAELGLEPVKKKAPAPPAAVKPSAPATSPTRTNAATPPPAPATAQPAKAISSQKPVRRVQAPQPVGARSVQGAPAEAAGKAALEALPSPIGSPRAGKAVPAPEKAKPLPPPRMPVPPKPNPAAQASTSAAAPKPAPPATVQAPGPEVERSIEPITAFGSYTEPDRKGFQPRFFGVLAGVLVLTGTTFFVLKPKGREAPPAGDRAVTSPATGGGAVPSILTDATSTSRVGASQSSKGSATPARPKPKAQPQPTPPAPKLEDAAPLAPESSVNLDIRIPVRPEEEGTETPAATVSGDVSGEERPSSAPQEEAPKAKVQVGDLVPLGEADAPPVAIKTPDPIYPAAAMSLGREGSVMVNALISETGDVIQTAVLGGSRGSLGFDKAAEAAVRKWKFTPARKDGVPVRVWKPVTIGFKLKT